MKLTRESILEDIAGFEQRIADARRKLDELPTWAETWKDRQKLKKKRWDFESEILHVQNLVRIATEALHRVSGNPADTRACENGFQRGSYSGDFEPRHTGV